MKTAHTPAKADVAQRPVRLPMQANTQARARHTSTVPGALLKMQRARGNQFVGHMLASGLIQAKLAVSQPGGTFELEADRVADQILRMPDPTVQRKCAACAAGGTCPKCKEEDERKIHRKAEGAAGGQQSVPESFVQNLGTGRPLDTATRAYFEPRFGADFVHVRIHTDARAVESAQAVNALAYTLDHEIVFGRDQYTSHTSVGRRLLAHELAHVVQQTAGWPGVQRYEAGEHAQFGETGAELKALVAEKELTYDVKPGDTLSAIAKKFGVSVKDLKDRNRAKLKTWQAAEGTGKAVEGFKARERIVIPPVINPAIAEALRTAELTVTISGKTLDYGVVNAMGDFYENFEEMLNVPKTELAKLAKLIQDEKSGTPASTTDWQTATGGRYLKLAEKNEPHFAPSNPALVKTRTSSSSDHKTEWEKYHKEALQNSQAGKKDEALQINAFGDHFLTDAFAGGHLINKRDVMEEFKANLTLGANKKFTPDAKAFFDAVAKLSFTGAVKTEFSKYETFESIWGGHPNIDSVSMLSRLLQRIQQEEPDIAANAVAKAVHDTLNKTPKGIPVENAKGEKWDLSGDGTLNVKSKEVGRKAVAQSQFNVLEAFKSVLKLDLKTLFKKVWDYVPWPRKEGVALIKSTVTSGTDPKDASLRKAVADLIKREYLEIINQMVARKKLKKA